MDLDQSMGNSLVHTKEHHNTNMVTYYTANIQEHHMLPNMAEVLKYLFQMLRLHQDQ